MPILVQCNYCQRRLRIQDELLGKTVKCPACSTKFVAANLEQAPAAVLQSASPPAGPQPEPSADEMMQTPVVPPIVPGTVESPQALDISEPASSSPPPSKPPSGGGKPKSAPPAVAPQVPTKPQPPRPFEMPALRVLGIMVAIVVLVLVLGCGVGSWLGSAVESAAASALD